VVAGAVVAAVVLVLASGWLDRLGRWHPVAARRAPAVLDVLGAVPDFALTERSGRQVTRADLLGRVWLATFIYTRCTDTCPVQSARVAQLQRELADRPDLAFVSMSVDPDWDTPAVLSTYAERFGADPARWLFLTGDRESIYRLATAGFKLGVSARGDPLPAGAQGRALTAAPPGVPAELVVHSARLVLVDRRARIRGYHVVDDPAGLDGVRRDLARLLHERP
jgi:cytochrome oxidase Cu insertion factor (SCO1/SenC/PrrC family)